MARFPKSAVDNTALLEAALEGLEAQKSRIDDQIAEVRRMLRRGGRPPAKSEGAATQPAQARRELSPAARKRIAAAQKRRWAEYRKKTGKKEPKAEA